MGIWHVHSRDGRQLWQCMEICSGLQGASIPELIVFATKDWWTWINLQKSMFQSGSGSKVPFQLASQHGIRPTKDCAMEFKRNSSMRNSQCWSLSVAQTSPATFCMGVLHDCNMEKTAHCMPHCTFCIICTQQQSLNDALETDLKSSILKSKKNRMVFNVPAKGPFMFVCHGPFMCVCCVCGCVAFLNVFNS